MASLTSTINVMACCSSTRVVAMLIGRFPLAVKCASLPPPLLGVRLLLHGECSQSAFFAAQKASSRAAREESQEVSTSHPVPCKWSGGTGGEPIPPATADDRDSLQSLPNARTRRGKLATSSAA